MSRYKSFGKYNGQTVSKAKDGQRLLIIRSGDTRLTLRKDEVSSLIIALLEVNQ